MNSKLAIARAYIAARFPRPLPETVMAGPVCDEAEMAANFGQYNALGVGLEEARRLAREELETGISPRAGYSFGLSTGTTGEPGVFITTQAERDRWLGTILGKFLAPGQLLTLNAALLLKHNSRLYEASRFVHFFGLTQTAAHWAPRLCDLAPNVLIGPPSALLALAETAAYQRRPFQPHTLLSAAEPLFPQDRERLRRVFGTSPVNLYQAKEGFLAAGCRHGGLHWNGDLVRLEGMRFKSRPDRAVPVITDAARTSQRFERYRMDDVLVLGEACPCQTPLRKFTAVEGRLQDILLDHSGGMYHPLFPLDINEALRTLRDYTLVQHDAGHFTLETVATPPAGVLQELNKALRNPARIDLAPLRGEAPGTKRRRFQRLFDPRNEIIREEMLLPPEPL
ncbi:MAG: hypothetical protein JNM66_09170 [Bryobacterales bacterium]|nr:hypothetical protein [Bryobacterales bacterium]